jgi:hypothetical protein
MPPQHCRSSKPLPRSQFSSHLQTAFSSQPETTVFMITLWPKRKRAFHFHRLFTAARDRSRGHSSSSQLQPAFSSQPETAFSLAARDHSFHDNTLAEAQARISFSPPLRRSSRPLSRPQFFVAATARIFIAATDRIFTRSQRPQFP